MKKATIVMTLACTLLLAGCGGNSSSSASVSGPTTSSSETPSSSSEQLSSIESTEPSLSESVESESSHSEESESKEESEEESIVTIDKSSVTEVSLGQTGGMLVDISLDFFIAEHREYECSLAVSNLDNGQLTFKSSRPESLTVSQKEGATAIFTLVTHAPGDSILSIYDADEFLVYRHIVRVRKFHTEEEIGEALYDFDTYTGIYDRHDIAFLDYNPIYGLYTGSDEVESNIEIEFNASFVEYDDYFDMYRYEVEILQANAGSQTKISSFLVSPTADQIVMYYMVGGQEAMLNAFYPKSLSYLHNDIL